NPLARGGEALRLDRRGAALPGDVFAQRELDARQRALKDQIARARLAPSELDDDGLAADRVRAAVEDVRRRRAAGQVAVDVRIGRIDDVFHAGHRADGDRAFV